VPARGDRLVEVVQGRLAERRDLLRVPVALEVGVVVPHRHLAEVQRVVDVPGEVAGARPEGERPIQRRAPDLEPAIRPEGVHVPLDVVDVGHRGGSGPYLGPDRTRPLDMLALVGIGYADHDRDLAQCLFSCSS
jgi:hypothetical protein